MNDRDSSPCEYVELTMAIPSSFLAVFSSSIHGKSPLDIISHSLSSSKLPSMLPSIAYLTGSHSLQLCAAYTLNFSTIDGLLRLGEMTKPCSTSILFSLEVYCSHTYSYVVPSNSSFVAFDSHPKADTNVPLSPMLLVVSPPYSEGCMDGSVEGVELGFDEGVELGNDDTVGDEEGLYISVG